MLSASDPFVDQEDGQFDALVGEDPSAAATFDYADESQAQLTWAFPLVVGPYDLCRPRQQHRELVAIRPQRVQCRAPTADLHRTGGSAEAFYPLMRDGYRDTVTVTFRVNQSVWNATMTVRDSAGTPVHTDDLGYVRADTYLPATWTWDGSTDRGGVAGVGTYTVHVTGTALSTGITGTATATDRSPSPPAGPPNASPAPGPAPAASPPPAAPAGSPATPATGRRTCPAPAAGSRG